MTIVDMLGQSLILTGLGLAVVFTFLIIMICVMYGSSALIKALKLDKKEKESQKNNALEEFEPDDATVEKGNGKRDVILKTALMPACAMSKLYSTIYVS